MPEREVLSMFLDDYALRGLGGVVASCRAWSPIHRRLAPHCAMLVASSSMGVPLRSE
jgi:hypothetical protein